MKLNYKKSWEKPSVSILEIKTLTTGSKDNPGLGEVSSEYKTNNPGGGGGTAQS